MRAYPAAIRVAKGVVMPTVSNVSNVSDVSDVSDVTRVPEASDAPEYVLQHEREELERLELQARSLEAATRLHLRIAGIEPGMRVLDLGTGVGDVAFLISEAVGSEGHVVGIDRSPVALAYAEERRRARGTPNVRFVEGDVRTWRDEDPFDAVVGRLILFHVPRHAAAVVRHHAAALRPEGIALMMDFDIGATRAEPPIALVDEGRDRVMAAFRAGGADPVMGTRLERVLVEAGLVDVRSVGCQAYLDAEGGMGPRLFAAVTRTLLPVMERAGIATAEEVGIDTFEERLADAQRAAEAIILPPTLVGATGRRPA
jgi:SAM-dependent methyltransferase